MSSYFVSRSVILFLLWCTAYGADNPCVWTNTDGKTLNLTAISTKLTVGWVPNHSQYFLLTPCSNGIVCESNSSTSYMAVHSGEKFPANDCEAYLATATVNDKPVEWSNANGGRVTFQYHGNWVQQHAACTDGINTSIVYQCNSADGEMLTPLTLSPPPEQCSVTLVENTSLACIY